MGLRPGAGTGGASNGSLGTESVDTAGPLAGFAGAAGPESVDTSLAGFGGRPHRRGGPTAIPAAFREALTVSRRTPVVSSMRRSDHPSRPRAITCCALSALPTIALA